MKKIFISIREKLIMIFLFFCIAPMLIIAYYSYKRTESILISSALSNLEVMAQLKAEQIERFYTRARLDLYTLQDSYLLKTGVPVLIDAGSGKKERNYQQVKKHIDNRIANFIKNREIGGVYIFGLDGSVLTKALQDKTEPIGKLSETAFAEGQKTTHFSDIYTDPSRTEHYYMTISAPLSDLEGKLIGVIVAEVVADYFFNQVQDSKGLGMTGETLIGKKIGDSVLFLSGLKYDKKARLSKRVRFGERVALPIQNAANGITGSGLSVDYRGAEVFAAWRPVMTVGWGIVAKIDSSEVLKPMAEVRKGIVTTGLMLLAFAVLSSIVLSKILTNPIGSIKRQLQEIKDGNLDYHATVSTSDELSILSHNISEIASEMRERTKSSEKMTHQATHDLLTGLANRPQLYKRLEAAVDNAKKSGGMFGVLFVDLDGFKPVNDSYGHEIGDMLLRSVATRLSGCVRDYDMVARYGGDEFIVVIEDVKNRENLSKIANTILKHMSDEFLLEGHSITIGASIGISIYPKDGTSPADLIRTADGAMYKAKMGGKNHFLYCDG